MHIKTDQKEKTMKTVKLILALALALATVFSTAACSVELGGEETWEYSSDEKEGVIQLFDDFFEGTYKNTNQIVTVKNGEKLVETETIDGTSSFVEYSTNGAKSYSFKDGEEFIYVVSAEESSYYMKGEENYNYGRYAYKLFLEGFKEVPGDSVTFKCEVKGSSKDDVSSETITLEATHSELGSLKLEATAKNDLVQTAAVTTVEGENTVVMTFTFEYGSAKVEIPDISGMSEQTF